MSEGGEPVLGARYELGPADLAYRERPGPPAELAAAGGERASAASLSARAAEAIRILRARQALPGRDASPTQVVEAQIVALKRGDEHTWRGLFAAWEPDGLRPGRGIPRAPGEDDLAAEWARARRMILGPVYDLRVVGVGPVETLVGGVLELDAPAVAGTTVTVAHIGRFGDEYRAFTGAGVRPLWRLVRFYDEPWRIVFPWTPRSSPRPLPAQPPEVEAAVERMLASLREPE